MYNLSQFSPFSSGSTDRNSVRKDVYSKRCGERIIYKDEHCPLRIAVYSRAKEKVGRTMEGEVTILALKMKIDTIRYHALTVLIYASQNYSPGVSR